MADNSSLIIHICTIDEWKIAIKKGSYTPISFANEGFIHCSTSRQIIKVANTYYPKASELVLIWIDPEKLDAPLKWEESDGDLFPHIYGPLNLPAIVAVYDFPPDSDGVFRKINDFFPYLR